VIVERLETEMKDINSNSEALKRNFLDLTELRHILSKTHHFFEEVCIRLTLLVTASWLLYTSVVFYVLVLYDGFVRRVPHRVIESRKP